MAPFAPFPFGKNYRRYEKNQVGPRPQQSAAIVTGTAGRVSSLRRLNDTTPSGPVGGFAFVYDIGTSVYVGNSVVATGFSSLRKSYVSYRPNASVQPWMYIGDTNQLMKVNANGTAYKTGIEEPQSPAISFQNDTAQFTNFGLFELGTSIWNPFLSCQVTSVAGSWRVPAASAITITGIVFDYGSSQGDGSLVPSATTNFGQRMMLLANGTNPIFAQSAQIAAPGNATINNVVGIPSIVYDSGSTGFAWIYIDSVPANLAIDSVYLINSGGGTQEYVRVIAVNIINTLSLLNPVAAIRVYTVNNHAAGETLTGAISFRITAPIGALAGQTLTAPAVRQRAIFAADIALMQAPGTSLQSQFLEGRMVQSTDTVYLLYRAQIQAGTSTLTNLVITFNLDPSNTDFKSNYLEWTIPAASIDTSGNWNVLSVSVATLQQTPPVSGTGRVGGNIALSIGTGVYGVQIVQNYSAIGAGDVDYFDFSDIVIAGQYGPTVLPGQSPDTWFYKYRSNEGAQSNPSPSMRVGQVTTAHGVVLQGTPSTDPQVFFMDWYRQGGSIATPVYVGTSPNNLNLFLDANDDITVENNQQIAFDDFEPFPSIDIPRKGVLSVNGFAASWVSGDIFNVRWLPGTIITINGIPNQLYNRPSSTTLLTLLEDAGTQTNVPYQIEEPTLANQPLPALWGPTDNVGYFFGCGDPIRPGTLYFTKANNPDSGPDTNQIEVTSPSEPLMNGVIVNGLSKVYSTERGWWIYPNYANVLETITGTQGTPFYLIEDKASRGLFARRGICTDGGDREFLIVKDGIRSGDRNITEEIYTLFPHEGGPQQNINLLGTLVKYPDYTNPDGMNLSFVDDRVYFDYEDVLGGFWTLVFDVLTEMWSVDIYTGTGGSTATVHTPNEGTVNGTIMGCVDGSIRNFNPTSPVETVQMALQTELVALEAPDWQHIHQPTMEYQAPTSAPSLEFVIDQGVTLGAGPNPPIQASQIKFAFQVPVTKCKLLQFQVFCSDPNFRMWTAGFIAKMGAWGRTGDYEKKLPFARFGMNAGGKA